MDDPQKGGAKQLAVKVDVPDTAGASRAAGEELPAVVVMHRDVAPLSAPREFREFRVRAAAGYLDFAFQAQAGGSLQGWHFPLVTETGRK